MNDDSGLVVTNDDDFFMTEEDLLIRMADSGDSLSRELHARIEGALRRELDKSDGEKEAALRTGE